MAAVLPQVESWLSVVPWWQLLVVAAVVGSVAALLGLARPRGAWGRHVRSRFVLGLPWGTLLTVGFVLAVYLFVQGGSEDLYDPLVTPFRSWSYLYPLGILTSSFTHGGFGHLTGNLIGTLAFAPIAEYAWSHFPTGRGESSFGQYRSNPFARLLVVPLAAIVAGLIGGVFAWGPVVGFSGVVFAFAGFALVYYPIPTLVMVVLSNVISVLFQAVRSPLVQESARPIYYTPWYANIAIQGHALGFLLGVLAAVALAYHRGHRPKPIYLYLAVLGFAIDRNLWAVYWYGDGETFQLFRALGTSLVFALTVLVVAAVTASDRPLFGEWLRSKIPDRPWLASIDLTIPRRQLAVGVLVIAVLSMSMAAIPTKLRTPADTELPGDPVEIRDYEITYAEDVANEQVSVLNTTIPGLNLTTSVTSSGVIVTSDARHIWAVALSKGQLQFRGTSTVTVGGVGWRRDVGVNRTGWSVVGNGSTYRVFLDPEELPRRLAFTADPTTAEPRIGNRSIAIRPTDERFELVVRERNATLGTGPLPTTGANVTVGGITFNRSQRDVYAIYDGTRVRVAQKEQSGRAALGG